MSSTSHHDEKIAKMKFASIYPHYVTKVERKGRNASGDHLALLALVSRKYNNRSMQNQPLNNSLQKQN